MSRHRLAFNHLHLLPNCPLLLQDLRVKHQIWKQIGLYTRLLPRLPPGPKLETWLSRPLHR